VCPSSMNLSEKDNRCDEHELLAVCISNAQCPPPASPTSSAADSAAAPVHSRQGPDLRCGASSSPAVPVPRTHARKVRSDLVTQKHDPVHSPWQVAEDRLASLCSGRPPLKQKSSAEQLSDSMPGQTRPSPSPRPPTHRPKRRGHPRRSHHSPPPCRGADRCC